MITVFVDYETYYSNEYSLRKMTPVEYVLDPRFECIGAGIKEGHTGVAYWIDGPDLPAFFAGLDPANTVLVYHNALFDACITAWVYNFVPALTVDTLGVARASLGHALKSLSLASVAAHLGLGTKGDAVLKVMGMGSAAIKSSGLWEEYTAYAINDVELCAGIYSKLVRDARYPVAELVIMDMVIRCAIQPQMQIDQTALAEHLNIIKSSKAELLARVGVDKSELMSNEKFAQALRNLGVEPPTKISMVTQKETWAFSKTDPAFIELEDHEDPAVQALVAARLGNKSTLEESRTERFLSISRLTLKGKPIGMPMPLRYSGAHTHRLSGDWKLNVQNMPRGGKLRSAIIAPPGYKVLASDASQIEARIVAWICGQTDLVEQFARGEDVYSVFASKIFDRTITKADKPERFLGKTCILGMGYGVGWTKFQRTVKLQSKAQSGSMIVLDDPEAQRIVRVYRETYDKIPQTWAKLGNAINVLSDRGSFEIGPVQFQKEAILLPSGLKLHYHDLQYKNEEWVYTHGGKPKRIYGGALLENIVQALARIVVMDAAVRLRKLFQPYGVQLALQVHDELVYVVPDDLAVVCKQITLEEMSRRPAWAPDLPLAAEADVGQSYGDAK
jgi:DNA polymerase